MAQELRALARVDAAESSLTDRKASVTLDLALSQGVPWRLFTLDDPRRLVLDFREVDWSGLTAEGLGSSAHIGDLRFGQYRPGWSRMVLALNTPLIVDTAEMRTDATSGAARLVVALARSDATTFAATTGAPRDPRWDLPEPAKTADPKAAKPDWAPIHVVLDPGHGGIDPGAEQGDVIEKDMMLRFARELRDMLRRSGRFEVTLTRDEDEFVSLERRISIAHEVGADVFISLHADSIQQGRARGATVYTLAQEASDKASAYLAERHDRADILAGVDLNGTDDQVTDILLDLARLENQPRSQKLAKALVQGMRDNAGSVNRKPIRSAGFSVLKAADIPSVLVELGFMSSQKDLDNLRDPNWRALMAAGIRDGLLAWLSEDKATRALMRQ
nr:N-acetylmuramoyl-L-alanine amidase [Shimia biformata]